MPIRLYGSSAIGVYLSSTNKYTFAPPELQEKTSRLISQTLGTEVVKVTIGKSHLVGVFLVCNDNGILVSSLVTDEELRTLKSLDLKVSVLNTRYTAIANLVLTNNKVTMVSPLIERESVKVIEDTLDTVVHVGSICSSPLIGSMAVANNRGVLVSADASDDDLKRIRDVFGLPVDVCTVNRGRTVLRSGIIANDNGCLVGNETTGFEIVRIMQVLGRT